MRPTDYPLDLAALKRHWTQYMLSNSAETQVDHAAFDPLVLSSWKRCYVRLDPLSMSVPPLPTQTAINSLLAGQADLLTFTLPYLEDILEYTSEAGFAIFLADRTGCVLSVKTQMDSAEITAQHSLNIGQYWSEGQLGCNAIALALTTAMPVQVVGAEHFFQRYHDMATAAAPIHDANGRVAGIIGLACPAARASSRDLALIMSAARAISNQLQAESLIEEALHRLTQVNTIMDAVAEGIIMWDQWGRIHHCNQQTATMFGIPMTKLLGKQWDEVLQWPSDLCQTIDNSETVALLETHIRADNRHIPCFVTLRPDLGAPDETLGYIALFRPIRQVRRLVHEQVGTEATFQLDDLKSISPTMQRIVRQSKTAALGSIPVLLVGESGVGKTYVAQAIHNAGPRAQRPFLSINCRAIPRELMLADLLGIERSDTRQGRPSKFELADGGTLMLNQLHYLTLELQSALLEVIDRRLVMRLGGTRPVPVNVRIIATLPSKLDDLLDSNAIVPELYYRLSVFRFMIPPLRQRIEDIPLLADRFIARLSLGQTETAQLSDDALAILKRYPWPGNVRELETVLERALAQTENGVIRPMALPENVRTGRVLMDSPIPQPVMTVGEAEREAIIRAGYACNGIVSHMANELGIGRTTLWRKMRHLNITPQQFK